MFIDFAELKARLTIDQVFPLLGLTLKQTNPDQWRSPCLSCKSGGDRALVITKSKNAFFCFGSQKGGDLIALVSHIRGIGLKEAAQLIAESTGTVQASGAGKSTIPSTSTSSAGFGALSYLEPAHEAVAAVGFAPEFAKAHGIGYAPKGTMRGYVLVPFRDEQGTLLGYIGVQDCKLPADFTPNVVQLRKPA
jgi:hypothetical protein